MSKLRISQRPEWGALLLGLVWALGAAAMFCRTDDNAFLWMIGMGGIVSLGAVDLLTFRWSRP